MPQLFHDQDLPVFVFEKNAEVMLPEDPNAWPNEILQELFKQVSYIADFNTHVVIDRADAEKGFAFGHIEVSSKSESPAGAPPAQEQAAGIKHARIPIIVRERKLAPFDIMLTDDSKIIPLTESRLRQVMFRPQMFDVTSKTPGDISMIGQLYPPYRQNYGFGGGGSIANIGMGKTGEAEKEAGANRMLRISSKALRLTGGDASKIPENLRQAFGTAVAKLQRRAAKVSGGFGGWVKTRGGQETERKAQALKDRFGKTGSKKPTSAHFRSMGLNDADARSMADNWHKIAPTLTDSDLKSFHDAFVKHDAGGKTAAKKCHCTGDVCKCGCCGAMGKKASVLQSILPTINESDYQRLATELSEPDVKLAFAANPSCAGSLAILSQYRPMPMSKRAEAIVQSLAYDVAQATRNDDGTYRLKVASHHMWMPLSRDIDRGELVGLLGVKTALAVDQTGGVTVAEGADVGAESSEASRPEPIKDFGLYRVETTDGRQLVGYVFPNLMDVDGTSLPLAVFTNGSEYSLQSDICGVRSGDGQAIPEGPPRGHGMLFRVLPNGKAEATVPITIQASLEAGEGVQFMATSFSGDRVRLAPAPNVKSMTAVPGGAVLIPDDMQWLTLEGAKTVELVSNCEDAGQKEAAAQREFGIEIRSGGSDSFSCSGHPLEKLSRDQTDQLSLDDAAFLLAGYGVQPEYAFKKLAESVGAGHPVSVMTGRLVKTAAERLDASVQTGQQLLDLMPQLKQPFLVKEAASLPDSTAVDTVLSLGFLNAENIIEFLKALPTLDESQEHLCTLLLATRLGQREIPVSALEKAIRATEQVIEGLRVLAFQN